MISSLRDIIRPNVEPNAKKDCRFCWNLLPHIKNWWYEDYARSYPDLDFIDNVSKNLQKSKNCIITTSETFLDERGLEKSFPSLDLDRPIQGGNCVQFNGINQFLSIQKGTTTNSFLSNKKITLTFKINDISTAQFILSMGIATHLFYINAPTPQLRVGAIDTGFNPNVGQIYKAEIQYDASGNNIIELRIDGGIVWSGAASVTTTSFSFIYLAAFSSSNVNLLFDGVIYEFTISDFLHLKMDESSGSVCIDSSGNNNHGFLFNNPQRITDSSRPFDWQNQVGFTDGFEQLWTQQYSGFGYESSVSNGWTEVTRVDPFNILISRNIDADVGYLTALFTIRAGTINTVSFVFNNDSLDPLYDVEIISGAGTYLGTPLGSSHLSITDLDSNPTTIKVSYFSNTTSATFGIAPDTSSTNIGDSISFNSLHVYQGDNNTPTPNYIETDISISNGCILPRDESNVDFDILGNPLKYKGKANQIPVRKQSNCISFDGIDDYTSTNKRISPQIVTNLKWSGWVQTPNASTSISNIIASEYNANQLTGWTSQIANDGLFYWASFPNDSVGITQYTAYQTNEQFNDNIPHFFEIIYNLGQLTLIVDGREIELVDISVGAPVTQIFLDDDCHYRIGGLGFANTYFEGQIFNTKLENNGEIRAEHPFAEGSQPLPNGDIAYDVYNGNNLTLINNPAVGKQDIYHYNIENGFSRIANRGNITYTGTISEYSFYCFVNESNTNVVLGIDDAGGSNFHIAIHSGQISNALNKCSGITLDGLFISGSIRRDVLWSLIADGKVHKITVHDPDFTGFGTYRFNEYSGWGALGGGYYKWEINGEEIADEDINVSVLTERIPALNRDTNKDHPIGNKAGSLPFLPTTINYSFKYKSTLTFNVVGIDDRENSGASFHLAIQEGSGATALNSCSSVTIDGTNYTTLSRDQASNLLSDGAEHDIEINGALWGDYTKFNFGQYGVGANISDVRYSDWKFDNTPITPISLLEDIWRLNVGNDANGYKIVNPSKEFTHNDAETCYDFYNISINNTPSPETDNITNGYAYFDQSVIGIPSYVHNNGDSFSISVWKYVPPVSVFGGSIISIWDNSSPVRMSLGYAGNNDNVFINRNGAIDPLDFSANNALPKDQWNHIVFIHNEDTLQHSVYVNGQKILDNTTTTFDDITNISYPTIGNTSFPSAYPPDTRFRGFRMFRQALTEEQVHTLYNNGDTPYNAVNLPLTRNLLDISGNENHGLDENAIFIPNPIAGKFVEFPNITPPDSYKFGDTVSNPLFKRLINNQEDRFTMLSHTTYNDKALDALSSFSTD